MNRRRGFTIVELLVVIVVISILAAITVTAYNGIQSRGRNAARLSQLDQTDTLLKLYKAANGKYPNFPMTSGGWYCVGTGYPNGKCSDSSSETSPEATIINDSLKTFGSIPSGNHYPINGIAGPLIYVEDPTHFELASPFEGSTCPDKYPIKDPAGPAPGTIYCWRLIDINE